MRTVGIIGGLGPETAAKFYLRIIFSCYEKHRNVRPSILLWSIPLSYKIEEDLITKGKGEEKYLSYLLEASERLERGGADFLVMPCNTLHIFIDEIRKSVKTPVLSIIEETVKFLKQKRVEEVGILATATTIKHKLYQPKLKENGINSILPDDVIQKSLGEIISRLILNQMAGNEKKELYDIITTLSNGGKRIILLACTDLQLVLDEVEGVEIYDTMKILADAAVKEILD